MFHVHPDILSFFFILNILLLGLFSIAFSKRFGFAKGIPVEKSKPFGKDIVILKIANCNPFLLAAFFVTFLFVFGCKKREQPLNLPPYPIGYIPFSEESDKAEFQMCNNNVIVENGGRKSAYKGGIKGVWNYFQPIISNLEYHKKGENGYLTIRFLMNCKGEKDRYRTLAISKKFKPKEFSNDLTLPVLEAVKKMDGWVVAESDGHQYDSYNMLTFKIEDGQITDIIP